MKSLLSSKRSKAILGIGLIAIGIGVISKKVIGLKLFLISNIYSVSTTTDCWRFFSSSNLSKQASSHG